ncbi:Arc/MetJ-type ribon-helix-helix transcriptional regulator [Kaistia hirudinis]|uniref:Arc/MetJ-type ribon-helix-helix transcriptional regulator n=1 Tax=Kaistia hirudinis TaxID=1293440 RepID=A0A840ALE2_9HYPH|nr:ribbon-helix-helix domain-containing protein [Kaistia hirudinis]MBB3929385.1 Arc/MetJ-type ribon-helix-helix transcriptional regulator [Kaistia hirudinis]MBN9018590.1 hypothetical protein [Hyphomicrobiales bacterium]
MSEQTDDRRSRGRPRGHATLVGVRMPPDLLAALDRFIGEDGRALSRPEALRTAFREWATARGMVRHGPLDEGRRLEDLTSDNDG